MSKKLVALLLALLLLCAMLAGCSKSTTPSNTPGNTEAPAETTTPAAETEKPAEEPAKERTVGTTGLYINPDPNNPAVTAEPLSLPLATDDPLITFWQRWEHQAYPDGYNGSTMIPQQIYDATGIKIEINTASNAAAREQFNLMLVSGATDDIINEVEQFYTKGAADGIDNGLWIELTDYVAKYMPNYQAARAYSPTHTRGTVCDDGRLGWIYGLSYEPEVDYRGLGIRSDLLDELGLELPETIDDWTNCLTQMHETWGGFLSLPRYGYFTDSEFLSAYGLGATWYAVDGQARFGPTQPEYYDYLKLMKGWYDAGLINPDFAVEGQTAQAGSRHEIICFSYLWGLGGHNIYTWGMAAEDETPDLFYAGVQHPVLKKGDPVGRVCMKASCIREAAAVTVDAENPVLCCKLLDYFFSDEGSILLNYGPIGVSCEVDVNDTEHDAYSFYSDEVTSLYPHVKMTQAYDDEVAYNIANNGYASGVSWEWTFDKYAWFDFVFGIFYPERLLLQYEDFSAVTTNCLYWTEHNSGEWNYPTEATLSNEENEEYSHIYSDCETFLNETVAKIVAGIIDLDEGYQSLVSGLEQMNIQQCIDYKQAALDRYYAR